MARTYKYRLPEPAEFYLYKQLFREVVRDFRSNEPARFVDAVLFLQDSEYWFSVSGLNKQHFMDKLCEVSR